MIILPQFYSLCTGYLLSSASVAKYYYLLIIRGGLRWSEALGCSLCDVDVSDLVSDRVRTRGGTVHVHVPNHHGTNISVRCMRPYDE